MREVTKVTKIKCEVGFCTDMRSFLMNSVTAALRQQAELDNAKMAVQPFELVTCMTWLMKNDPMSVHNPVSL